MAKKTDHLQGNLELVILKALDCSPNHGFGISSHVAKASDGLLEIEEGSLYPALHRMERGKLVSGTWRVTENGRRAKLYTLTPAGRKRLGEVRDNWKILSRGMKKLLKFD